MDLARVDLVEQRHHDERVEDDGEVLRRRRVQTGLAAAVDVEQLVACRAQARWCQLSQTDPRDACLTRISCLVASHGSCQV